MNKNLVISSYEAQQLKKVEVMFRFAYDNLYHNEKLQIKCFL